MWKNLMEKFEELSGGVLILIFIALLLLIGGIVLSIGSKVQTTVGNTNKILDNYTYMSYDNKYVSGDAAIAAVKLAETPNPTKLQITVITGTTIDTTTQYGYQNDADTSYSGYNITDPSNLAYINAAATFKSSLQKSNNVVTGITFTEQ